MCSCYFCYNGINKYSNQDEYMWIKLCSVVNNKYVFDDEISFWNKNIKYNIALGIHL